MTGKGAAGKLVTVGDVVDPVLKAFFAALPRNNASQESRHGRAPWNGIRVAEEKQPGPVFKRYPLPPPGLQVRIYVNLKFAPTGRYCGRSPPSGVFPAAELVRAIILMPE